VTATVDVSNLEKVFKVPVREGGLKESVRSLFKREYRHVHAVDDVSFQLQPGEIVGFLGPNGAGKTTTIKTLTGLLHADGGDARVLGYQPWRRQKELLRRITLVMGQRNNLQWDLPAIDSFDLNQAIYGIPQNDYVARRDEYVELMEAGDLITKPVRNLSLGERMKVELIAALLHKPEVLFLDEPTIGLDVTMQKRLRGFIAEYNRRTGATVLLTSHYMADVTALCERVIVIHHGKLLYDGLLEDLADRFSQTKTITVIAAEMGGELQRLGEVIERSPGKLVLQVPKDRVADAVTNLVSTSTGITDLSIDEPPIEDVIEQVFASPGRSQ
jgi:ABC-2 type transport system ATP-binding protein